MTGEEGEKKGGRARKRKIGGGKGWVKEGRRKVGVSGHFEISSGNAASTELSTRRSTALVRGKQPHGDSRKSLLTGELFSFVLVKILALLRSDLVRVGLIACWPKSTKIKSAGRGI